jgi:hypothetical protein
LKSLPGLKHKLTEGDNINAENVFVSCDLQFGETSCNNEIQFGGRNNFQEYKQPYENHEQTVIPTKREKRQKSVSIFNKRVCDLKRLITLNLCA